MPYKTASGGYGGYSKERAKSGGKATVHATPGPGTIAGDVVVPKVSGKAGKRRKYAEWGRTPTQVFGK